MRSGPDRLAFASGSRVVLWWRDTAVPVERVRISGAGSRRECAVKPTREGELPWSATGLAPRAGRWHWDAVGAGGQVLAAGEFELLEPGRVAALRAHYAEPAHEAGADSLGAEWSSVLAALRDGYVLQ